MNSLANRPVAGGRGAKNMPKFVLSPDLLMDIDHAISRDFNGMEREEFIEVACRDYIKQLDKARRLARAGR